MSNTLASEHYRLLQAEELQVRFERDLGRPPVDMAELEEWRVSNAIEGPVAPSDDAFVRLATRQAIRQQTGGVESSS